MHYFTFTTWRSWSVCFCFARSKLGKHGIHSDVSYPSENEESNFLGCILDRGLVSTAISASSAQEPTNYQRLEFLGDSILKLSTSLALMSTHLSYHEKILSNMKDHVVSNGSLARAATRTGLDQFIITKPFTGAKWRP